MVNRSYIDVYTDRSLSLAPRPRRHLRNEVRNSPEIGLDATMGAVFIIQQDESLFSFAQVKNWPSSTKAKLAAIFIALLTMPVKAQVTIHTDSQCAIQSIQKFQLISSQYWLKSTNTLWLLNIDSIIQENYYMCNL